MARKKIKKYSVVELPSAVGNISDTINVADKVHNAPSINLVQNMTGIPQDGVIYYDGEVVPEGYEEVKNPNVITQIPWNEIISMREGVDCLEGLAFKDRNRYFGNIVIYRKGGFPVNCEVANFVKPMIGIHNTGCFLTHSQWNAQAVGYCYISTNTIIITDSTGQGWTVAKINFDLVANE